MRAGFRHARDRGPQRRLRRSCRAGTLSAWMNARAGNGGVRKGSAFLFERSSEFALHWIEARRSPAQRRSSEEAIDQCLIFVVDPTLGELVLANGVLQNPRDFGNVALSFEAFACDDEAKRFARSDIQDSH